MTRPPTPAERLRLRTLIDCVAADRGVDRADLLGPSRRADLARVRFAAAWIARTATGASWAEIGRQLGDRDRATVIHAARRAEALRATDPAFRSLTDRLLAGAQP